MTSRGSRIWLGIAVLLFLLQELPLFKARWVEDESWYSVTGYTFLKEGRLRNPTFAGTSDSRVDMKPPAMPLTLASAFRVLGVGIVPARLLSLIAGLALIPLVFLLGLELAGPRVAAAAALLVATDNFVFLAARTVRPEAYVAFFGTLAFLLWARSRRTRSLWLLLLSGLSAGIAVNYHPVAVALAFSLGCLVLFEFLRGFWKAPHIVAVTLGIAIALVPFALWVRSDSEHYTAFKEMYLKRGASQSLQQRLASERKRYADFLGASSQRLPLPVNIPYRLHVAAALIASLAAVCWRNRSLACTILITTLPILLLWIYLPNKSPRYFAVIGPLFGILIAGAAFATWQAKRFIAVATVVVALIVVTQIAGNAMLLYRSRPADYSSVASELRRLIPAGQSAYGAITFWMALHDRSFYSYNHSSFDYAMEKVRPSYMIVKDRVMMSGEGYGEDDNAVLRQKCLAFTAAHGSFVGNVPNSFYGNLEVFELHY
jgi:4-amino-4-deoxy-L-arabinose transferase-like glycosyltransferase